MSELSMGASEMRFADLIWRSEPISSTELAKLCEQELGWKKSTTYTVLKRLCEKGIFRNQGSIVTSCMTEREFHARRSENFVEETFDGSLPAFLTAFTERRKLSPEELSEIRRMIDSLEAETES